MAIVNIVSFFFSFQCGEKDDTVVLSLMRLSMSSRRGGRGGRGIGRDFDRSFWPGGRVFELSCRPGGRDI